MKRRSAESKDDKKPQLNLGFNEIIGGPAPESGSEEPAVSAAPGTDQFSTLASKEDWQSLSELSEKNILGISPDHDAEAKLWWTLSQFHLSLVPVSILAAPLDLLSRDLEDGRLGSNPEAAARIRDLVTSLLRLFVPKLKEAGDARTAEVFQSRLDVLTGNEIFPDSSPDVEKTPEEKEPRQVRKGLSESERLRMDLGITHDAPPPHPGVDPAFLETLTKEENSFWKGYFVIGLVVAVLATAGLWWFISRQERAALASAAVPAAPESVASRREMKPKTPEIARIEDVNSLSSLLLTIDEKKQPAAGPPPASRQAQAGPTASGPARRKERIDTNYPPEPGSREYSEKGRDPLWGDQKREERSPFGDDDSERGIPVTKFPRPEVYRVITDTLVLPRPSLRSQPIQKLRRGDEVLVEAKVGYWLRLRSKSNRPGFILAQDAEVK